MRRFIMKYLMMRRSSALFYVVVVIGILLWIRFYHSAASASPVYASVESLTALNNDPKNLNDLQLRVKFSHPMHRESVENAIILILSGVWEIPFTAGWEDEATVLLRPVAPLEMCKPLTIIISPEAISIDGKKLEGEYTHFIVTGLANPTVRSTEPENNSRSQPLNASIKIFFSQAMDQYSTESAFSLKPEGGGDGVRGSVSWTEDSTCLTFTADSELENGRWYLCIISTAARDIFNQKMPESYTFRFLSSPL
jgi:hypothetical protein